MNLLKSIGKALIWAMWLFNSFAIRSIITVEAFTFLVLMPFMSHLGLTFGPHVPVVYAHRAAFLIGVPLVTTLLSLGRSHIKLALFTNWKVFAGLSFLCNLYTLVLMCRMWPESVHVEIPYAIYCAGFMTAVSFFASWMFKNSAMNTPPSWKKEQTS